VPVCSFLFGICDDGHPKIRAVQRRLAGGEEDLPVSSVGRPRVRSGSLKFWQRPEFLFDSGSYALFDLAKIRPRIRNPDLSVFNQRKRISIE
jgi:hypothetical protein